jgi:hypothetical protein
MLLHGFFDRLTGKNKEAWNEGRIRGTAVLVKKEVLGFNHFHASLLDGVHQILGQEQGLAFRLVSATAADPGEPPPPPPPLFSFPSSFLPSSRRQLTPRPCTWRASRKRNAAPRVAFSVAHFGSVSVPRCGVCPRRPENRRRCRSARRIRPVHLLSV